MSAELNLLFLEKRVEAAKLCAAITEPFATGTEPANVEELIADYQQVAGALKGSYDELTALNDGLEKDKALESGDIRHVRNRIQTAVGEVARCAQDFSAQIRFFEAMNPNDAPKLKPVLDSFDEVEKGTRDFTAPDAPEEGAELAPAEEAGLDDDVDPMLM